MLKTSILFAVLLVCLDAQPHFLPISGSGSCTAGNKYVINSTADLKRNVQDLECIFAAGLAPDAIGLGFNYGTVLLGENSVAPQIFAAPAYQGDYVVRTVCNKETVFLGTIKVAGISVGTAPWFLTPFIGPVAPFEAPIDPTIANIVMDFRQNIHDICPVEDLAAMLNQKGFLPFKNPPPPVNCFVDIGRVVGRDAVDNGIILLFKGMNHDPDIGWQTSLIYSIKNFDPEVKPTFVPGTELIVPSSFTYVHQGFKSTFSRFGASGLIPFLFNAKQTIDTALASNPLVAAIALKQARLFGGGIEPITMSTPSIPPNIESSPLLGGFRPGRIIEQSNNVVQEMPYFISPTTEKEPLESVEITELPSLDELQDMLRVLVSLEQQRYAYSNLD